MASAWRERERKGEGKEQEEGGGKKGVGREGEKRGEGKMTLENLERSICTFWSVKDTI